MTAPSAVMIMLYGHFGRMAQQLPSDYQCTSSTNTSCVTEKRQQQCFVFTSGWRAAGTTLTAAGRRGALGLQQPGIVESRMDHGPASCDHRFIPARPEQVEVYPARYLPECLLECVDGRGGVWSKASDWRLSSDGSRGLGRGFLTCIRAFSQRQHRIIHFSLLLSAHGGCWNPVRF